MTGLVSLTTYAPLVGVILLLGARALHGDNAKTDTLAKWIALATTLVTFALSAVLVA